MNNPLKLINTNERLARPGEVRYEQAKPFVYAAQLGIEIIIITLEILNSIYKKSPLPRMSNHSTKCNLKHY